MAGGGAYVSLRCVRTAAVRAPLGAQRGMDQVVSRWREMEATTGRADDFKFLLTNAFPISKNRFLQ